MKALNAERASANRPPLKARDKLNRTASRIAREYAAADTLELKERSEDMLTILKRLGYRFSKVAESAASGQPGVPEVLKTWMDSPPHREHVLGDFTEVGVGYAQSPSGKPSLAASFLARPLRN